MIRRAGYAVRNEEEDHERRVSLASILKVTLLQHQAVRRVYGRTVPVVGGEPSRMAVGFLVVRRKGPPINGMKRGKISFLFAVFVVGTLDGEWFGRSWWWHIAALAFLAKILLVSRFAA